MVALVDDDDYEYLKLISWHATIKNRGHYYVQNGMVGLMHRFIMGAPAGKVIDHIDHNPLNNQKTNLRICDIGNNAMNRCTRNKTGFKGVYINNNGSIMSLINVNRKRLYLGAFNNIDDAARAYNKAASKYYGEYAMLNEV